MITELKNCSFENRYDVLGTLVMRRKPNGQAATCWSRQFSVKFNFQHKCQYVKGSDAPAELQATCQESLFMTNNDGSL